MPPNNYSIAAVDSILAIDADSFHKLTPANDPFLSHSFFAALERHGAAASRLGWTPQHLVARNAQGDIVGLLPLYIKTNSFGEFIYDWSWARAFEQCARTGDFVADEVADRRRDLARGDIGFGDAEMPHVLGGKVDATTRPVGRDVLDEPRDRDRAR